MVRIGADDFEADHAAAEVLGRIGPAAAVALPELRVAAQHRNTEVRKAAQRAIAQIARDPANVKWLRDVRSRTAWMDRTRNEGTTER